MNDAYQEKIARSKQPKKFKVVQNILHYFLLGIRKGYDTQTLCNRLNEYGIKPLVADSWTYHSTQMQIMFMARLDSSSSLGRAFGYMLHIGAATEADMALLQDRVQKRQ
ncbi:hypothetical protein JAB5_51880 [Janthinobacterium sp. HH103]|uniref:hypothetical protein n=1 Tax=unclassified Janthinobacterium TaxID=2610881 RepID=UPI0008738F96|nr:MULTISPECIES: hypothetical protein [unclassified Janthinobacterium]OEZ67937.1 hypothetical protein JAB5_51880 [Janthinobacterium sp. HH103]OEZ68399.1 hypothetical protein JAB2_18110 [Janthinobacterium sp. HH100]QOU71547.1 hypothetical protein JAB4_009580 [Janthinobacterium sp. HH102]